MSACKTRPTLVALVLIGLGLATSAWARIDLPEPVVVSRAPAGVPMRSVGFAKVAFSMARGQAIAELQAGLLCVPKIIIPWEGLAEDDPSFADAFASEIRAAGFKLADTGDLFATSSPRPDLLVAAKVTDVRGEYCFKYAGLGSLAGKGGVKATVEWQIYSPTEQRIVARIPTVAGTSDPALAKNSQAAMARAAFAQNVRALINTREFRDLVTRDAVAGPPAAGGNPGEASAVLTFATPASSPSVPDAVGSVVAIFTGSAFGSGFVVADGYLLTNSHVVGDARVVRIRWSDGLETTGQVLRTERRRDVALIAADTRGRAVLAARAEPVQPGDTVFAIGTPLDPKFQSTLTKGIVSATRTIDGLSFIQSDVTVNHGNSGGPLLDEKGRVVGVTVLGIEQEGAPTGINLFIPARDALDFLSVKMASKPRPGPAPQATPARAIASVPAQPAHAAASEPTRLHAAVAFASAGASLDEFGAPIRNMAGWIADHLHVEGWDYIGADARAAYFERPADVSSPSPGVLQGTFRAELFRLDGSTASSTYSEKAVWQINCGKRQVRQTSVTNYDIRNLRGSGLLKESPDASWETPDSESVAAKVVRTLCPSSTVATRR